MPIKKVKDKIWNSQFLHVTLTQDELRSGGVIVTGVILCSHCRKKMDGVCNCGSYKCLISIYWKGKHYEYRRDDQGYVLTYERAVDKLTEISSAIKKKIFNPIDFTDEKTKERKFENKIQQWLIQKEKELNRGTIRPSSYSNITGHVYNHILPFFTEYDVKEINKELLSDFRDGLPDTIKRKTKHNIFITLHSFFVWLWDRGVRDIPPFPKIDDADDSKDRIALDYDEQVISLAKIPEGIEREMLEFGMETGVRPGELVVLKVKDVDRKNGTMWVRRTISKYTYEIESTKGGTRKIIPLSDRAFEIASSHCEGKHPESYLFVNPKTRTRYSVKAPNRIWKKYTGINVTYYEGSRHSFCTQLVDNGADVLQARELMRHTDVRTTQKYYHGNMTRLKNLVNRRGKVIELKDGSESEASF